MNYNSIFYVITYFIIFILFFNKLSSLQGNQNLKVVIYCDGYNTAQRSEICLDRIRNPNASICKQKFGRGFSPAWQVKCLQNLVPKHLFDPFRRTTGTLPVPKNLW
jgi:hypothetical protein